MLPTSVPVDYIARTRAQYAALGFKAYRWVENFGEPPWTSLQRPVAESRIALIASGGIYQQGQVAFHHQDDLSVRIIKTTTPMDQLRTSHFAYDQTDARADPNIIFPIESLTALVRDKVIGALADKAYTFMGGIYSSRKVKQTLAPEFTTRLIADQIDLALLVPV